MYQPFPALNEAALTRLQELGGRQLVCEMIDLFLTHAARLVETAWAAWTAQDLTAVQRAVHSLKTSASTLGADHVRFLAQDMESHLKDVPDQQTMQRQLEVLQAAMDLALNTLREHRRNLSEVHESV